MTIKVVKTINATDPTTRIVIVQRDDGMFSFAAERFHGKTFRPRLKGQKQHTWIRGQLDPNIYKSVKIAERYARIRFPNLT